MQIMYTLVYRYVYCTSCPCGVSIELKVIDYKIRFISDDLTIEVSCNVCNSLLTKIVNIGSVHTNKLTLYVYAWRPMRVIKDNPDLLLLYIHSQILSN